MHKHKDVLTTGQVAKICNVAPRTVSKWFDGGQLRGYRIPGSRDRRIPLTHLVNFMKAHGMPLNGLDVGSTRVLVLDDRTGLAALPREALAVEHDLEVSCALTAFEAGVAAEHAQPAVMVVNVTLPDVSPDQLCRDLRAHATLESMKLIAVSDTMTDAEGQRMIQAGFHAFLRKPFTAGQLAEVMARATGNAR